VSELYDYTEFGHWDEESGSYYCPRDSPPPDLGHVVHQCVVCQPPGSPLTPLLHSDDQALSSSSEQAVAPALQDLQEITPLVRSSSPILQHTPSLELQYPASPVPQYPPAFLSPLVSPSPFARTVCLVTLLPHPLSLLERSFTPNSQINYHRIAEGVEHIDTPPVEPLEEEVHESPCQVSPSSNQENDPLVVLCTNRAYCVTCRFWVQSHIRTSVWGCTSISRAGLKTNVNGIDVYL